jgi:adenosylmethionine---8-amino-7-oxononanoate aminotransferase
MHINSKKDYTACSTDDIELTAKDNENIWHPFTPINFVPDNIIVAKGEGACFIDAAGNRYIDAISSWWVNLHGHCNPYIANAVTAQMATLEHSIFAGFSHIPAITLAEQLLQVLPDFQKVFFSDNGSTSVEVALKMALQYWWNKGTPKYKVLAFRSSYHGDTFGSMSVGARNAFNTPFEPLLFDVIFIDLPNEDNFNQICSELMQILEKQDVACFIFEPLILGAGGMLMYEARFLQELIAICKAHNCITIADEVMTGFGRTGRFFAIDFLENRPDIICLSKGITGGFFPLGVTICKQFIFDAYKSSDKRKTFFHGHSYTGNPTTCAAAIASMELMHLPETKVNIERIVASHCQFIWKLSESKKIRNIRQNGTVLAFDLITDEGTGYLNSAAENIAEFFIKKNIIIRPLGNVIYVLPPYCIMDFELQQIYNAIIELVC